MDETVMINMLKMAVEQKGCRLTDVDFERQIVKFEGPDEAKMDCALAIEKILDL